jgi:hypothetical protein
MFAEAVDFDGDFIILSTPRSRVEQAVGRILRGKNTDVHPLIFDLVDMFSVFRKQYYARKGFYSRRGFQIHTFTGEEVENLYNNLR